MQVFKAIFWDNDGTLVDTEPLFFEATKQVLSEVGVTLTMDFYINKQLKLNISTYELAREKGISEDRIIELRRKRNKIFMDSLEKGIEPMDGVEAVLESLESKYLMGIVTSSRLDHFEMTMRSAGIKQYFDFVITKEDITNEKPDPEPYLLALERTGLLPEECLVIEDTERGVVSAKAANLTCYAIPNELSKENDFSASDRVLGSIGELIELLQY